ncbi:IstB-like ATP binding protein [Acetitomaculum ruminis DSM 5522]|uniref:IstB-like ATP binding protein n=1 Tax=Acetitomaculum ruminis DSM 5522 TaxID=1120918 RepID=A0A1I1AFM9_9FIRM|nr:B-box zinc finger protein [Acetitomaculum ruminis]SFB36801.1 IstB-like ATP binding protein [Acetitomaculum ruminis DSM 5522]
MCYYHHDEPAVAKCVRCGKYLCQDCFDSYGVSKGKCAGQALCYDFTQQLISDDLAELEANKNIIKIQFILSLVGIGIGFILGLIIGIGEGNFISALVSAIFMAGIGGVFLTFLKAYLVVAWALININFSDWDSIFYDAIVANAILDRILHHSKVITINGRSYRIKDYVKSSE